MSDLVIRPFPGRVQVSVNEHALADSREAVEVIEPGRETVLYLPRSDIEMEFLSRSDHVSTCPIKGRASYFSAFFEGRVLENFAWSYEAAEAPAERIAGLIAFDPSQVQITASAV